MSDIIAGVDQNFYMKFFYDIVNSTSDIPDVEDGEIVIINIQEMSDNEIANVLLQIKEKNPAVVGIDKLFSDHEYVENDSLLMAIRSLAPKVVAPLYLKRRILDKSIGKTDIDSASFCKGENNNLSNMGSVHLRDYYAPLDSMDIYLWQEQSGKLYRDTLGLMFDYLVARESGLLQHTVRKNMRSMFINYRNKRFLESSPRYLNDLDLEGKVVLVGNPQGLTEDYHDLPFKVNDDTRLSGLNILAFSISSMITPFGNDTNNRQLTQAYSKASFPINAIFSFIYVLIYSALYSILFKLQDKVRDTIKGKYKKTVCAIMTGLFTTALLLLSELGMLYLCFIFTKHLCIVPNLLGLIFSIVCVNIVFSPVSKVIEQEC